MSPAEDQVSIQELCYKELVTGVSNLRMMEDSNFEKPHIGTCEQ